MPDRLQGRARHQRLDTDRQAAARDGAVLDRAHRARAGDGAKGEGGVPSAPLHALRQRPVHRVVRRPGSALPEGRRSRDHRPGEVHRVQELRGRVSLRRHLLQRWSEHRAEVHRLRPPARQRLDRAAVRRRLPDAGHQDDGRGRGAGAHRGGRGLEAGAQGRAETTRVLPQPAQEVHRRDAVRPGRGGGRHRSRVHADGVRRRRGPHRSRPTATATSGSRGSRTACTTCGSPTATWPRTSPASIRRSGTSTWVTSRWSDRGRSAKQAAGPLSVRRAGRLLRAAEVAAFPATGYSSLQGLGVRRTPGEDDRPRRKGRVMSGWEQSRREQRERPSQARRERGEAAVVLSRPLLRLRVQARAAQVPLDPQRRAARDAHRRDGRR